MNFINGIQICVVIVICILFQQDYAIKKQQLKDELFRMRVIKSYQHVYNFQAEFGSDYKTGIKNHIAELKSAERIVWKKHFYRILFACCSLIIPILLFLRYYTIYDNEDSDYQLNIAYLKYGVLCWMVNFVYLLVGSYVFYTISEDVSVGILMYLFAIINLMIATLDIGKIVYIQDSKAIWQKYLTRSVVVVLYYHLIGIIIFGYIMVQSFSGVIIQKTIAYLMEQFSN